MAYLREEEERWRRGFYARYRELRETMTHLQAVRQMAQERATEEEMQSAGAMMEKRIWVDDILKKCKRNEKRERQREAQLMRETREGQDWRQGDGGVVTEIPRL